MKKRRARRPRRLSRVDEDHLFKISHLRAFVEKHGWSAVTRGVVRGGVNLFSYVTNRRIAYREGRINDEIVEALEMIEGWTWEPVRDLHRKNLDALRSLVRKAGWKGLRSHAGREGHRLAIWCRSRRKEYKLGTIDHRVRDALEAMPGWSWEPVDDRYEEWLRLLRVFVAERGMGALTRDARDESGAAIGNWANWVRYQYRNDRLPGWVLLALDGIDGWSWQPVTDQQRARLELLRGYIDGHGWKSFRFTLVIDGVQVGRWTNSCLSRYRRGELSTWLARELESIPGWKWR